MTTLIQDTRYALRQFRKTPGFTLTVLLTLALGIGANAAIFTLMNAMLLKNLPVTDPKTLVRLGDNSNCCVGGGIREDGDYTYFSTDTYEQIKKNTPEFEELAAMQAGFEYRPIIARRTGKRTEARSMMGEFVSGNYFRTFGLRAAAGRLFTDSDDAASAPLTAVMSYKAWQSNYAGDRSIVGSTFWINTKPVTVIGIAPQGFYGDRISTTPPDFFLPIETMPVLTNAPYIHDPNVPWLYIVGRIRPGVSLPALQQKVSNRLRQIFVASNRYTSASEKALLPRVHVLLTPGGAGIQNMQDQYAAHLRLLMWISGLVLLIACANIANLLLVRGMARKAEMSVRAALGATRSRIIRQLLTESVLLSVLGGIAGLIVAYMGTRMLLLMAFPGVQDLPIHASPSPVVIGFACGLSLITGVLFGIAPAWIASNAEPADALRSGTRTTVGGVSLLQRGLVVLQAALSLILLVGAGLFARSLSRMQNTDMKLDTTNRYIVHINPEAAGYSASQLEALYRTIEDRFHAVPGVQKVGLALYTPMEDNAWNTDVVIQGQRYIDKSASWVRANADYFDSVGTHVVMGRGIGVQDTSTAPAIAVVNQAFVKTFLKGLNPIGQHFGTSDAAAGDYQIVGVVEDTIYHNLDWKNRPMYFLAMTQEPARLAVERNKDESLYAGAIVLQTSRPMTDMEALSRRTLAAINPNLSVVKFQTFDEQIADRFTSERMIARLTMLFGILALLLATVGLYGVTAYGVARRTSEIGIRMALGAERLSVVTMVMRSAILQTALGLVIGIPIALLCVRFIKAQLYDITSIDATTMAVSVLTLTAAACLAGIFPARRAASVDPAKALRTE